MHRVEYVNVELLHKLEISCLRSLTRETALVHGLPRHSELFLCMIVDHARSQPETEILGLRAIQFGASFLKLGGPLISSSQSQ